MNKKVTVIGAAIVDIMAGAVDKELFRKASVPAKHMEMTCGGDALNEAVVLANLGVPCELITLLGEDEAAETVMKCLRNNGVEASRITKTADIATGINIVLVDDAGERYFITNPESSLRKLSKECILPYVEEMGDIVSFGSVFVSSMLSTRDMEEVFKKVKEKPGRILVADMTTAKHNERIEDLEPVLKYIDYIIPNEIEAATLTGENDPESNAMKFLEHGSKCVVIKCGKNGCVYADDKGVHRIPAHPATVVDTTGAGDSFVAGFIYGLSEGMSLPDCCRYGCATASVVVEHMGAKCIKGAATEVDKRFKALERNPI